MPKTILKTWLAGQLRTRGYKLQRVSLDAYSEATVMRDIFADSVDEQRLVVDVGSHKGLFIDQVLRASPEAEVLGFEPIPELFSALQAKFASTPNVTIRNSAAGAEPAKTSFHVHAHTDSSSVLPSDPDYARRYPSQMDVAREIEVAVEPLDSIATLADREVWLLKADVQGYEGEVLRGAPKVLSRCRYVVLEGSFAPTYEGGIMMDELCHLMVIAGFRLRYAFNVYAASADLFWERT